MGIQEKVCVRNQGVPILRAPSPLTTPPFFVDEAIVPEASSPQSTSDLRGSPYLSGTYSPHSPESTCTALLSPSLLSFDVHCQLLSTSAEDGSEDELPLNKEPEPATSGGEQVCTLYGYPLIICLVC